jgi:hypothetical protein
VIGGARLLKRLNPVAELPVWCKDLFTLDLKVAEPQASVSAIYVDFLVSIAILPGSVSVWRTKTI